MSAALLDDVRAFIRRFVVLTDHQADALALWVAHTHCFDAFPCTPYLAISSPEKRSGKTRLLEVLELLVREPTATANISDAALFRLIHDKHPSLLVDEADAIFGRKAREREELRGLLNAGYRHGAKAHRMGGKNNTELKTFDVYCPKAFAGIGDCLPDTITDRAIPIRLKRRTRDEQLERFNLRDVEPAGHELRDRLADWLEPQHDHLAAQRPQLPEELDDRAQDVWEPLFAIDDLVAWARSRPAAIALSSGEEREDDSLTAILIRDIHVVFSSNGTKRYRTAELIEELARIEESPWGDWHGKLITPQALSKLLKPYRIKTMPVKVDGLTVRGYKVEQFADAFARVLGVTGVTGVTGESASQAGGNAGNASNAHHANGQIPLPGAPGFPFHADAAHQKGHLTDLELEQHLALHRLLLSVPEAPPPLSDREADEIAATLEADEAA